MVDIVMTVEWRPVWYSRYEHGGVTTLANALGVGIDKVARKGTTIKVYTIEDDWPLDGKFVEINGVVVKMIRRGRFGHLHHGSTSHGLYS